MNGLKCDTTPPANYGYSELEQSGMSVLQFYRLGWPGV